MDASVTDDLDPDESCASGSSRRKSGRVSKLCRRFSPPREKIPTNRGRKKRKNTSTEEADKGSPQYDLTPDGQPFSCDLCCSRYIIDPSRRQKIGRKKLSPRQRFDAATGRYLMLCNACGLSLKYQKKRPVKLKDDSSKEEEKEHYLSEAKSFAESLVANLGDANAEKLYCPRFTSKPCRCIQSYLVSGGRNENYRKRALYLLKLIKSAQKLSTLKCYDLNDVMSKKVRKKVGMGNGHKKSKVYENFVMSNRSQLKDTSNLCEMAIKKILCYSNNFLFKRLKSEQRECRVDKVKGRGRKDGGLLSIENIANEKCCQGKCALMARTHGALLQEWRDRAAQGQSETRRVLAEMLTPSGLKTNCYNFIRMVTGVTASVISSVNSYMIQTSGCRDPPPHGLKAFWANHPKRRRHGDSDTEDVPSSSLPQTPGTSGINMCEKNAKPVPVGRLDLVQEPHLLDVMSRDTSQSLLSQGEAAMSDSLTLAECDVMSGVVSGENTTTLEFVTFIGPDGHSQIMQVPVMNCSSFDGLDQDVNLQIAADPGSLQLEALRPSGSKGEPGEPGNAYMDGDLLEGVRVNQDPNLGQTVDIILEKGDKTLENMRIPISAQVMSRTDVVAGVDPNDLAGISQFHIFTGNGSPTNQVLCSGPGNDLAGTFGFGHSEDMQQKDSLVTIVDKGESEQMVQLESGTEAQGDAALAPNSMVSLEHHGEGSTGSAQIKENDSHGLESVQLWKRIPPLQEGPTNHGVNLQKNTLEGIFSSKTSQVLKGDEFENISDQCQEPTEKKILNAVISSNLPMVKAVASESINQKKQNYHEQKVVSVPTVSEPVKLATSHQSKVSFRTTDIHPAQVQAETFSADTRLLITKPTRAEAAKTIHADSLLQTDPQELIERSQQLIAESEKVVGQSAQLAQQPVMPSQQVTEQLQNLLGQSRKLAGQQQLTAVQLEQLSAAQSLQQLSTMQPPFSISQELSEEKSGLLQKGAEAPKMQLPVSQPLKLMPVLLQQQFGILQPEQLNVIIPSSMPAVQNIQTVSMVKTPHVVTQSTMATQSIHPTIVSYSQSQQNINQKRSKVAKKQTVDSSTVQLLQGLSKVCVPDSKEAKNQPVIAQSTGLPNIALTMPQPLVSSKDKKSAFILPKQQATSKPPVLAPVPQTSKQLLLPVMAPGLTVTLGTDQKGTPQFLIPCISTDKPKNPTKPHTESSPHSGFRPLLPNTKPQTTHVPGHFIPINSSQQRVGLKSAELGKLYGSNTIILQHPKGGSFSVQHLPTAGGPVTFHAQGTDSIQDLVKFSNIGTPLVNKASDIGVAVMGSRSVAPAIHGEDQKSKPTTAKASSKHHLKELLPVLPKSSHSMKP